MRLRIWFYALLVCCVATQAPAASEHRLRRVDLSKDANTIHALSVVGAPHLTTTIRLPDSFAASNVACGGDCVDAQLLGSGQGGNLGANWVLDLRPQERTLHLWPASLPTADNPASAFRSNIYVGLDGGDVLNVAISLLEPGQPASQADALVDVLSSKNLAYSGRLEQEKQTLTQRTQDQVRLALEADLQQQLSATTDCRNVRWGVPHRHEKLVVRVRQVCATKAADSLRWVVFTVENRAHVSLPLGPMRLAPELDALAVASQYRERGASALDPVLAPGASTQGVAMVQLFGRRLGRSGWSLHVEAQEPRHEQVRIGHIHF